MVPDASAPMQRGCWKPDASRKPEACCPQHLPEAPRLWLRELTQARRECAPLHLWLTKSSCLSCLGNAGLGLLKLCVLIKAQIHDFSCEYKAPDNTRLATLSHGSASSGPSRAGYPLPRGTAPPWEELDVQHQFHP